MGLEHFFGQFNVVHARLISVGVRSLCLLYRLALSNIQIKDYAGLVDQISRVLRPGGLVCFCESNFRMYDKDKKAYEITEDEKCESGLALIYYHIVKSVRKRGM